MSVEREYSRALESLIDLLRSVDDRVNSTRIEALQAARVESNRDLSAAARTARGALSAIENETLGDVAPDRTIQSVEDAAEHLEAHCRAILGDS